VNDQAATLLASFAAGRDDPAAIELLRDALRRWMVSDDSLPLQRYMGLKRAADLRRADRDRWLRRAATHVRDVGELALAIRRFEGGAWRCWRRGDVPPGQGSELEQALFFALRAGALPASTKQLRRIVRDTESAGDVPAIAA
jgi:hypothetical protein